MIGTVENVKKSAANKTQRSLKPARTQANESRVAFKLECSNSATRRQKSKNTDDSQPQPAKTRLNRKAGSIRFDRILKHHIEQALIPVELRFIRELCAGYQNCLIIK